MSLLSTIVIGVIILLILIGLGLLIWFLIRRFEGPTGSPGPSGSSGSSGPPPTNVYISNVIAQTSPNCPSGYISPQLFGGSNGNLKQGTGEDTPNIYLCLGQTTDFNSAITDLNVFQFTDIIGEEDCPQGSRVTYNLNGTDEWDFEKSCGGLSPATKLCVIGPGSGADPLKNIAITATEGQCPTGYDLAPIDDTTGGAGTSGDLNRRCGGATIMLCLQR